MRSFPPGIHGFALGVAFLCLTLPLPAQEENATPPPKPAPPPSGYQGPDRILEKIAGLGGEITDLARTPEGRPLRLIAFGSPDEAADRPEILVVADPDASKPVASELAWALAEHFASGSPLLDAASVYLLPVANPDAAARVHAGGEAWRGAPVDEDRDGLVDEDPVDDIDGDGRALWMRIPDPTGEWMADPADPRALRKPDPKKGEAGAFRLLREGRDDDGDRLYNEDPSGGIRLDANYPHRWHEHAPEAGPFPLSETLSHALADWVLAHPNLALILVLGPEDDLAKPPKGGDGSGHDLKEIRKEDAPLHAALGSRLYQDLEQKPVGEPGKRGSFADWAYFQAGALVLRSAVWSPALPQGEEDEALRLLRWADELYGPDVAFRPWTEAELPRLGKIEVGGWLPLVRHNPPAETIPALGQRYAAFLDSLAGDFAHLVWTRVEDRDLGSGVHDLRAVLVNEGLLPTSTKMGQIDAVRLPVRIRLELPPGATLLSGRARLSAGRLEGHGGHQEVHWVYRLPADSPPVTVVADAPSAGRAVLTLDEETAR